MVGLLRPRTVYLKSNECASFSVSLRCDFSVSSSPYCSTVVRALGNQVWLHQWPMDWCFVSNLDYDIMQFSHSTTHPLPVGSLYF